MIAPSQRANPQEAAGENDAFTVFDEVSGLLIAMDDDIVPPSIRRNHILGVSPRMFYPERQWRNGMLMANWQLLSRVLQMARGMVQWRNIPRSMPQAQMIEHGAQNSVDPSSS